MGEVGNTEEVKVAAGEFEAEWVNTRVKRNGKTQHEMAFWLSPQFGVVKNDLNGTE